MAEPCNFSDRHAIIDVLNAYATALDARDWDGLEAVFHEHAVGHYGTVLEGRSAIVGSIRGFLDGCGATQHLLGNHRIDIDGDRAQCATKARVIHIGAGERATLTPYEAIGVYRDQLVRTPEGWRIMHRHFDVYITLGDFNVLQPA
jgi:3-phenylpropionate/cinnamic acid dioxygenase small subunit